MTPNQKTIPMLEKSNWRFRFAIFGAKQQPSPSQAPIPPPKTGSEPSFIITRNPCDKPSLSLIRIIVVIQPRIFNGQRFVELFPVDFALLLLLFLSLGFVVLISFDVSLALLLLLDLSLSSLPCEDEGRDNVDEEGIGNTSVGGGEEARKPLKLVWLLSPNSADGTDVGDVEELNKRSGDRVVIDSNDPNRVSTAANCNTKHAL
jgi:hypothetical protein